MYSVSRPFGITILSAYYLLWGLATVLWSLLTSVFGVVLVCFAPGLLIGGLWGLIQGVLSMILGFSLYSGKDWARALVMLLAIIGIVISVLSGAGGGFGIGEILNIAVNTFVLFYVNSERVKQFFATN
ncbi:MAG: hypothetical protein CUN49_01810 [Candidatus Thermofonsia Clade 1 bacterium]|jgi:hypothetical protein|uniref:Uncharacterized protein n=1 Tax=Candidatus Thermofonsia Clade 1 bacterium TaxID=2364210 RepID=A0A2M8PHV6_9CHLR|nr:MAG: hypothetical protein CUN49_01810 [Candidatus Thermofonsia Clade 1 bacterium]RMF54060.1 MAG: hypothetical protein D6749_00485 [Chloroflexota bacterium]